MKRCYKCNKMREDDDFYYCKFSQKLMNKCKFCLTDASTESMHGSKQRITALKVNYKIQNKFGPRRTFSFFDLITMARQYIADKKNYEQTS